MPHDLVREGPVFKADLQRGITEGVVLSPYILDKENDWFSPRETEEFAYQFLSKSRELRFGSHELAKSDQDPIAVPVSSFLVPYPSPEDYAKAMSVRWESGQVVGEPHRVFKMALGSQFILSGEWVLGFQAQNEAARGPIAKGIYNAFSVGANEVLHGQLPDDFDPTTLISEVIDLTIRSA